MQRTLLGVAGFPVAHSRSPAMHNAALAHMGLDWLYVPLPLPPERFVETVAVLAASGYRGVNVTVPHKAAAHSAADTHSPAADAIGAANTLTFEGGATKADNTDAGGFLDALGAPAAGLCALVLGAGGSARAVAWALAGAGAAEVSVWNRTAERARSLARDLGVRHVDKPEPADLIVNCTSVGLDRATSTEESIEVLALAGLDPPPVVVDLVYGKEPTPIERWAGAGGARVVGGLEVLVHQGARSLQIWTGREAPVQVMRHAAQARSGIGT